MFLKNTCQSCDSTFSGQIIQINTQWTCAKHMYIDSHCMSFQSAISHNLVHPPNPVSSTECSDFKSMRPKLSFPHSALLNGFFWSSGYIRPMSRLRDSLRVRVVSFCTDRKPKGIDRCQHWVSWTNPSLDRNSFPAG